MVFYRGHKRGPKTTEKHCLEKKKKEGTQESYTYTGAAIKNESDTCNLKY